MVRSREEKRKNTRQYLFFLFRPNKDNVTVHLRARVQCSHKYDAAQPQFTGSSKDCSVTFSFSPSRCRNSRGTADHGVGRTSRDPSQQPGVAFGYLQVLFLKPIVFVFSSSLLLSSYQELTKVRDRFMLRQGFPSSKKTNQSSNPNLSFTERSH